MWKTFLLALTPWKCTWTISANKEKQLLEKQQKAKLQYEKQLEERHRKLKEQKEKDERRRVSAEEKRKQKQAEDKVCNFPVCPFSAGIVCIWNIV